MMLNKGIVLEIRNESMEERAKYYHNEWEKKLDQMENGHRVTLLDKSYRLKELLYFVYNGDDEENKKIIAIAIRSAIICKIGEVSQIGNEFPELKAKGASWIAKHNGFDSEVVGCIANHSLPQNANDELPTRSSAWLALVDKLDDLVGSYFIGNRSTPKKDPYKHRRLAIAILKITEHNSLEIDLRKLITECIKQQEISYQLKEEEQLWGEKFWNLREEILEFIFSKKKNMQQISGQVI